MIEHQCIIKQSTEFDIIMYLIFINNYTSTRSPMYLTLRTAHTDILGYPFKMQLKIETDIR